MNKHNIKFIVLFLGITLVQACTSQPALPGADDPMCHHGPDRAPHSSEHQCTDITYDEFERQRQQQNNKTSDNNST